MPGDVRGAMRQAWASDPSIAVLGFDVPLKHVAMLLLVAETTATVLVTRYSRTTATEVRV